MKVKEINEKAGKIYNRKIRNDDEVKGRRY